jgi:O-antigen ligase
VAERLIWIVPLVVAVAGLWRPRAGLLVLVASLPLFGSPPGGPYLGALDAAGLAAIVTAWRAGRAEPSALAWPAAAFVAVSLATLAPSPYQPPSWQPAMLVELLQALPGVQTWSALYTWRAAADLVLGWGLFVAVRRAFAGRSARPLATAVLVGLSLTMLLGLAEAGGVLDLGGYRRGLEGGRLQSLFFLSGWLAEYIVIAAPLAIFALARQRRGERWLLPTLLVLAVVCLALTQQRGAWAAALVQLLLCSALAWPHWRRAPRQLRRNLVAAGGAVVVAAVVLVGSGSLVPLAQRVRDIESGFSSRAGLWTAALEMSRERPLSGWGLGSFTPAYDLLRAGDAAEARRHRGTAHSLYLNVAAERGLLGLLALGLLLWATAAALRRPLEGEKLLALALAISLAGFLAYGLVQYMFHLRCIAWLFWLLLGAVATAVRPREAAITSRMARVLVAAALLLTTVRLFAHEPPAYAGNRSFGLHEQAVGSEHRWTEGFAAQRLEWQGDTLVLRLANGHPRAGERPVDVTVGVDGRRVARLTLADGWQRVRIEPGAPRRETILLTLAARPTFRPFSEYRRYPELEGSRDIRSLGVAIEQPVWESSE